MDLHKLIRELIDIRNEVEHDLKIAASASAREVLVSLEKRADKVGRAWSKSWIGDQANLYYRDFKRPPPDEEFDQLSGKLLRDQSSWVQYSNEDVLSRINEGLDVRGVERATKIANKCTLTFKERKGDVISILEIADSQENSYINGIRMAINDVRIPAENQILNELAPNGIITRDILALSKGPRTPPHLRLFAQTASVRQGIDALSSLNKNIEKAVKHFQRTTKEGTSDLRNEDNIYIGHGRSPQWREFKDFLQDRLGLEWDEFERVPTAGFTITDRLSKMLDSSRFAFLVLTAEDETAEGKMQARMNVIHEAGLFQGRLGFDRAIILLEEGCEEFSNKHGLVHIPFSIGNIKSTFEEVRRVLEDRGIISR